MAEDPDESLVERAKRELPRGTAAYDALVHRHTAAVYRRCYGILRSNADAQEATQDVFLAVFRNLPRLRPERPFSHWLGVITTNACRMILRRRASEQRRRSAFEQRGVPTNPFAGVSDVFARELVAELLDEFEPGTRIAMLMRFVEGFTYGEIAQELDLSESAVKMRVSRGAKRLRALYEERTQGPEGPEESGDGPT